jgi:hypothetical protein
LSPVRSGSETEVVLLERHVRSTTAGSTGRRNTGVKSLCWGFKLQGLTWSFDTLHGLVIGKPPAIEIGVGKNPRYIESLRHRRSRPHVICIGAKRLP